MKYPVDIQIMGRLCGQRHLVVPHTVIYRHRVAEVPVPVRLVAVHIVSMVDIVPMLLSNHPHTIIYQVHMDSMVRNHASSYNIYILWSYTLNNKIPNHIPSRNRERVYKTAHQIIYKIIYLKSYSNLTTTSVLRLAFGVGGFLLLLLHSSYSTFHFDL